MSEYDPVLGLVPSAAVTLAKLFNDRTVTDFTYVTKDYRKGIQELAKNALNAAHGDPNCRNTTYSTNLSDDFYRDYAYSYILTAISRYDTWEWKNTPSELVSKSAPNEPKFELREDLTTVLLSLYSEEEVLAQLHANVAAGRYYSERNYEDYKDFITKRDEKFAEYMNKLVFPDKEKFKGWQFALYIHSKDVNISTFNEYLSDNWKYSDYYIEQDIDFPDVLVSLDPVTRQVSFRTKRDDINVGEVAKTFGGGGHAKAAGAVLTPEDFTSLLMEYYIAEAVKIDK
jgi:oligoribonuclease NrnB/cAMP/cGMP phosphodiesterase (DHH superfamily)